MDSTLEILDQLIQNGDVVVQGELKKYLSGLTNNIYIYPSDPSVPNFYPLVLKYLRLSISGERVVSRDVVVNPQQTVLATNVIMFLMLLVTKQLE